MNEWEAGACGSVKLTTEHRLGQVTFLLCLILVSQFLCEGNEPRILYRSSGFVDYVDHLKRNFILEFLLFSQNRPFIG